MQNQERCISKALALSQSIRPHWLHMASLQLQGQLPTSIVHGQCSFEFLITSSNVFSTYSTS